MSGPDETLLVTSEALVTCDHVLGKVGLKPSQSWVTTAGEPLLVRPDPESRPVSGCPNIGATIRPCLHTLSVRVGYSNLVTIDQCAVVLTTLAGFTDGTPPGAVEYGVRDPAQTFIRSAS